MKQNESFRRIQAVFELVVVTAIQVLLMAVIAIVVAELFLDRLYRVRRTDTGSPYGHGPPRHRTA